MGWPSAKFVLVSSNEAQTGSDLAAIVCAPPPESKNNSLAVQLLVLCGTYQFVCKSRECDFRPDLCKVPLTKVKHTWLELVVYVDELRRFSCH